MALYVSCGAEVLVQIRAPKPVTNRDGQIIATSNRLFAQFQRGACPDWAMDEVLGRLNFRGLAEGEPVTLRMGTFDSIIAQGQYGWSDEERELVESELDKRQGSQWIRIEAPKLTPPWPKYDELKVHGQRTFEKVAEKNIETAEAIGANLEDLIAYERQNRNDERIIELYEAALLESKEDEPTEELVEA